jgi:hypothetical protein
VNTTNATGTDPVHGAGLCDAASGNPPWPGTKVCDVCTACLQLYPNCTCCQPTYDNAESCSLCRVQDAYIRSQYGDPAFAYRCGTNAGGCTAVPGSVTNCKNGPGGPCLCFATVSECSQNCNSYNCVNGNTCVQAAKEGTPAKYPGLAACNVSCSTAPLSPCGRVKPAQCTFWQQFHGATGGGDFPPKWPYCGSLRGDPCSCGGRTCDPTQYDTRVTCKGGDITGMYVLPRTLHHKRCCLFPSLYYLQTECHPPPPTPRRRPHTACHTSTPAQHASHTTLACMKW